VNDTLNIQGFIGTPDGRTLIRNELQGPMEQAEALGTALAHDLLARGGQAIIRIATHDQS